MESSDSRGHKIRRSKRKRSGHIHPHGESTIATQRILPSAPTKILCPLTADEIRELVACEEIIAKGWDTFVDVGRALAQIRDKRLYRAECDTFEVYCRDKWSYGKSHAYRLIGAATVISYLSPIGDVPLPCNESQVRPLLGMKADEVKTIWCEAVKKAGPKNVTAEIVKQTAAKFASRTNKGMPSSRPQPPESDIRSMIQHYQALLQKATQLLDQGNVRAAIIALKDITKGIRAQSL